MNNLAFLIMIITGISHIIGFFRDIILSYFYGTSYISDAYVISLTIPDVLFVFFATAISTGYIPIYSRVKYTQGDEEGNKFTNNVANAVIILCMIIVVVFLIFTPFFVKLFASGFEGEVLRLAILFTRYSLVSVFFTSLVYLYRAYLQVNNKFIVTSLIGFPLNIFLILSIFISYYTNEIALPIGVVIANFSQLLFLVPALKSSDYSYSFHFDSKDDNLHTMLKIVGPAIVGESVNQVNALVSRNIASLIIIGGVSSLNYAQRLTMFLQTVIVMSITTVLYPKISKLAVNDQFGELKETLSDAISSINILLIPASVGFIVFSKEIVMFLFGRGAFDTNSVNLTSAALQMYSIGILAVGMRDVFVKAFYSFHDTKTPLINSIIGMIINLILSFVLGYTLGISGLALSTSISAFITVILLYLSLVKRIGKFKSPHLKTDTIKITISSILMGIAGRFMYTLIIGYLPLSISLILVIGLCISFYLILVLSLRVNNVNYYLNVLKNKIIKR